MNNTLDVPALHETAQDVYDWATSWTTVTARQHGRLVAAVRARARAQGTTWEIGRLMVAPDLAGRGMGSTLLAVIESMAPPECSKFELFTGANSERNIRTYERAGYELTAPAESSTSGHISGAVYMSKPRTTKRG